MAQAASADLRLLKTVVIVLGILLIAGSGALVATLALRAAGSARGEAAAPVQLSLPSEARIANMALGDNMLALHIEHAQSEEILLVDLERGAVTRRLKVARP